MNWVWLGRGDQMNRREVVALRRLLFANKIKSIRQLFDQPLIKKWVDTWSALDKVGLKHHLDKLESLPEKDQARETKKMLNELKNMLK